MKTAPYKPRVYLPKEVDLSDTLELEKIYTRLEADLKAVETVPELETWLDHYGEVEAAIAQVGEERGIAVSLHKDDADLENANSYFIDVVSKWCERHDIVLERLLAAHPAFAQLPPYYDVYRESILKDIALYREKNVDRQAEETHLCEEYDTLYSELSGTFEGKEMTTDQIDAVLEDPDRARREAAWRTSCAIWAAQTETLHDLYDKQVNVRTEIAREAGFENYRDYYFDSMGRDYTPDDCFKLHEAIEKHVVPLVRRLNEERRQTLGLETLRPWDMSVDALNRAPLKPFANVEELMDKTQASFDALSPRLGEQFRKLRDLELMDLDNRKGKAPGGYSTDLAEARLPFTFANSVGIHWDVVTTEHEAGHDFHSLAYRDQRLYDYRASIPMEFCEVASTAMEHLGATQYSKFYPPAEARRAERQILEDAISILPRIAMVDAFQHWVYTHPEEGREARNQKWVELGQRFDTGVDRSGVEEFLPASWQQTPHIFDAPMYFIEYAIARTGSLQIWSKARQEGPEAVLEQYFNGLELGGSKPLQELFAAAGLKFDLSEEFLGPLMAEVAQELDRLNDAPRPQRAPVAQLDFKKSHEVAAPVESEIGLGLEQIQG